MVQKNRKLNKKKLAKLLTRFILSLGLDAFLLIFLCLTACDACFIAYKNWDKKTNFTPIEEYLAPDPIVDISDTAVIFHFWGHGGNNKDMVLVDSLLGISTYSVDVSQLEYIQDVDNCVRSLIKTTDPQYFLEKYYEKYVHESNYVDIYFIIDKENTAIIEELERLQNRFY